MTSTPGPATLEAETPLGAVPDKGEQALRCTIFSPVVDRQAIDVVRKILPGWSLHLEGDADRWTSARFTDDQGAFVLNSMEFTGPLDAFGRILLGTSGYFLGRDDLSEETKRDNIRFVGDTRWLVGIVGTAESPSLSEAVFFEAALELARRLDGKVFTGTELVGRAK